MLRSLVTASVIALGCPAIALPAPAQSRGFSGRSGFERFESPAFERREERFESPAFERREEFFEHRRLVHRPFFSVGFFGGFPYYPYYPPYYPAHYPYYPY